MSTTLEELYLKYVNGVGRSLEDDRYFQYLYELIGASSNVIHQTNRVLHKVVDEQWLNVIEESLDAINDIIEKPRRFVTTEEEVVPVALAKKITADSVRHLSMNTQFIASDQDGDIQPTRVLNVSTTESYDLYENRFIYHLIQRLVTFIDKRTDVIFWSTGDETKNILSFQSAVDDAYETIDYKLEMTIKNKQSFAENDSDNMQTFMRIDRVRRMVMALKNSSFCDLMAGCASVRSPIQRTNLMIKDPSYRTCYKLWQFLESYDDVGYTIVEQDRALEFDEEYLLQLYTHFITGYAVFKSLLPADERHMDNQTLAKHRRTRKPKFLKQIQEEEVTDPDLPDVEIRRVFVEGVTQAQLDAEAALAEEKKENEVLRAQETELVQRLQEVLDKLDAQAARLAETENTLRDREADLAGARERAAELERTLEEEKTRLLTEAQTQLQALADEASARLSAVEEQAQKAECAQREAVEQLETLRQEAEQLREDKAAAETESLGLREELAAVDAEIARLREEKAAVDAEIAQLREEKAAAETEIARLREEKAAVDAEIAQLREEKAAAETEIAQLREEIAQAAQEREDPELLVLREDLAAANAEAAQLREEKAAVDAEIAQLREELAQAGEGRTFAPDDWASTGGNEQTEALRQELAQALQAKEEAEKRVAQAQREAKAMMAQAAEQRAQAEVRAAEAAVRAAREAEARLEAEKQAERGLGRLFSGKRRDKEQNGEG